MKLLIPLTIFVKLLVLFELVFAVLFNVFKIFPNPVLFEFPFVRLLIAFNPEVILFNLLSDVPLVKLFIVFKPLVILFNPLLLLLFVKLLIAFNPDVILYNFKL